MIFADYLRQLFDYPLVRRAAWLAFLSWVVALTLTGYIFGFADGFFGKLFSATFVLWLLLAGTSLGIVPLVQWLTRRLSDSPGRPAARRGKTPPRRAAARPSRPAPPTIPANKWR